MRKRATPLLFIAGCATARIGAHKTYLALDKIERPVAKALDPKQSCASKATIRCAAQQSYAETTCATKLC